MKSRTTTAQSTKSGTSAPVSTRKTNQTEISIDQQIQYAAMTQGFDEDAAINNAMQFQMAIQNAQLKGYDYIEVETPFFRFLSQGLATPAITYGNPGVKVYEAGTREKIDLWEKYSLDDRLRAEVQAKVEGVSPWQITLAAKPQALGPVELVTMTSGPGYVLRGT